MFDLPISLSVPVRAILLTVSALLWVVLLVRIVGLRSFSKMTAFDFVATVAMGSLLAAAAMSKSWEGFALVLLAMAALMAAQASLALLRRRSERLHDLLGNTPVLLMEKGVFCEAALRETRVHREDVMAKIRSANVGRLSDVEAVVLENTGDISVLHGGSVGDEILEGVRRVGR